MKVGPEQRRRKEERALLRVEAMVRAKQQNDCADGRHVYDRYSFLPEYKGWKACRCGAVQGALES